MQFKISKDIQEQSIDYFACLGDEVMKYLRDNGFETVEDIIDRQHEIPDRLLNPIKGKLIFGIELKVDPEVPAKKKTKTRKKPASKKK